MTLSKRAREHVRERHPEMGRYERLVLQTLSEPEVLLRGPLGEGKAVGFWPETHLGPKFVVVVFREADGRKKDIITAYFTSDLKRIKGDVVWRA